MYGPGGLISYIRFPNGVNLLVSRTPEFPSVFDCDLFIFWTRIRICTVIDKPFPGGPLLCLKCKKVVPKCLS